ncbi:Rid family detoxifying hydrolase [Alicyclobacillus dauci]|uniref:Rid family detoxifying hydrolase n=1 Tax=Alicyclobacillus dauci TaxID=1475485 RepID=A0ABY6Z3T2_9BACL|nr:Rid family detoxifying hydrolase [Alicyclobacillus dauci]WAH37327.1 Rid family detoxifying hydrolase [Alicyclobacillus dauci]
MNIIHTNQAPAAIGPYSQAVEVGPFLYTSGQIPLTPRGEFVEGGIDVQVKQVFANLDAVLTEAKAARNQVVKATIFMTNLQDFGVVNTACEEFFGDHKPARSTVQVAALPRGAQVEIELVVYKG